MDLQKYCPALDTPHNHEDIFNEQTDYIDLCYIITVPRSWVPFSFTYSYIVSYIRSEKPRERK